MSKSGKFIRNIVLNALNRVANRDGSLDDVELEVSETIEKGLRTVETKTFTIMIERETIVSAIKKVETIVKREADNQNIHSISVKLTRRP